MSGKVRGDAAARKAQPLARGVLDYFPDALLAVAELSRIGNEQHNPGQPMHWAKEKSTDEADALLRHLIDRGTVDTDGVRHSAKVAWRALTLLQREIDAEGARCDADWSDTEWDKCTAGHAVDDQGDCVLGRTETQTPPTPDIWSDWLARMQREVREKLDLQTLKSLAKEHPEWMAPPHELACCSICGRPECGSTENIPMGG